MTPEPRYVHTAAELEALWRRLIEPLGFGSRQIFAILIDRNGEVVPSVINVTDCPRLPDAEMTDGLASVLRGALDGVDPDGSCALVWARPSDAGSRSTDLEWARALTSAFTREGMHRWPLHIADDTVMWVVAPDDLAA